ncbi:MAG: 3-phosphoshikimate 1-carboxyvinyltransferase [Bacteroidaceae bacterium]|nr:3-phosphoshikimate 1-carboxyvinyltransferase [Bacteroidaceae bacterium]
MHIALNIPKKLMADIALPTSKSISNRALMLHALCAEQRYTIERLAVCDDTNHMQEGIAAKIAGAPLIDIGATGTAMRFLTAYLAITPGETVLTGSERMQQRPIGTLVEALRTLGADITYTKNEGYPPLRIKGKPLQGGELEIEAGISSQYISALLMIGPCLTKGLTLYLKGNIASRTYIELTLDLMRHYGAVAEWADERTIRIEPGHYIDKPLTVEGDWSAASYWYELAAVAAHYGYEIDICLHSMRKDSHQGDRVVAHLFEELGVKTTYTKEGARLVASPNPSQGGELSVAMPAAPLLGRGGGEALDFTHCPDIAQTMAVTYCLLGIPFVFTGIQSLRIKETDRVAALINELRKLGFVLRAEGDEKLVWDGTSCPPDVCPTICTYDDHRMAMAFAPAALCHENLTIEHPEVVTKSYPGFWEDLKQIDRHK